MKQLTRNDWYGDLTDDELMNGIPVTGLADLMRLAPADRAAAAVRNHRAQRLATLLDHALFHLGLVQLLQDHPEVDAVVIDRPLTGRNPNLARSLSLVTNAQRDTLPARERARADRRMEALRRAWPHTSTDKSALGELFRTFTLLDSLTLTRDTTHDYLRQTIGDTLFELWFVQAERTILRDGLDNLPTGHGPNVPRKRL